MAVFVCNRCNEAIVGDSRRSNDKTYHVQCFTCAICDTPIDAATRHIKTNLQEVYCRECHQRYFQDVSRHNILESQSGAAENDRDESLQRQQLVGDGDGEVGLGGHVKVEDVAAMKNNVKINSEQNSEEPESKKNLSSQEIKAMLHKYSTPVHSIHEIMPPPMVPSVKKALRPKPQTLPDTSKSWATPTIEEETIESVVQPKLVESASTLLTSTPKKKARPRSRIPILTPVSSRTQIEGSSTPLVKSKCATNLHTCPSTPRRNRSEISRNSTPAPGAPVTPKSSAAVTDYLKNKTKRGHDGSRTPSRKGTPMKATHSLPKTCPSPMTRPKLDFPKSRSCMSTEASSFSRPCTTGGCVSTSRNSDSQASASTAFIVPRNVPQKMRQNSSKSEHRTNYIARSHSNNLSHSHMQLMSWNNLQVSPTQLPSTQQLFSLMVNPGEKFQPVCDSLSRVSSGLSSRSIRSRSGYLDCPICYDGLVDDSSIEKIHNSSRKSHENVVTVCGHIFHRECITNWLISNGNDKCPICQKECAQESLISVYLDANSTDEAKSEDTGLSSLVKSLRFAYKELVDKYNCLLKEHQECGVKCAISDSLRTAYEVECRNRVELQWENKRLQRKIEDLQGKIKDAQCDTPNPNRT